MHVHKRHNCTLNNRDYDTLLIGIDDGLHNSLTCVGRIAPHDNNPLLPAICRVFSPVTSAAAPRFAVFTSDAPRFAAPTSDAMAELWPEGSAASCPPRWVAKRPGNIHIRCAHAAPQACNIMAACPPAACTFDQWVLHHCSWLCGVLSPCVAGLLVSVA